MFNRRHFLRVSLACSGAAYSCFCDAQTAPRIFGCIVPKNRTSELFNKSGKPVLYVTGEEPIVLKSGNKDFDYALAHTLVKISNSFNVLPGFAYYDDTEGKNAYATPAVRLKNADGTVLFGQKLLDEIFRTKQEPDVVVASVCAHEFGHILQFKHGLDKIVLKNQPTVKRAELQADFLAGYFAGIRKKERPSFPAAVFAMTQYEFGDPHVSQEGHHGTQEERGKAVSEGFKLASSSIEQVIEASTRFAMTM